MMKLLLSSLSDRNRGVLIQIIFIVFVLFLIPGGSSSSDVATGYRLNRKFSPYLKLSSTKSYVVIFDGGSSGSRVHVYCFDQNLELVPIGEDLDVYAETKPGLSAYASDPQAAANSLTSLLDTAGSVVPQDLQPTTPIKLGATAGLRQLEDDVSERILQAVRDLFKNKSAFEYKPEWVVVLDGSQEGSYAWVSINYLVGNLGKKYSNTFGMIDLGGGSVQMAYAISEKDAAKAPTVPDGEDKYVNEMYLMGRKYFIYVHSYLNYGLLAARAEILNVTGDDYNPCILAGYDGFYKYGEKEYKASAFPSGSNIKKCRSVAIKALRVEDTCIYEKCTFAGIWNGGGGDGQKNMYVASFFYDKAAEVGFISQNETAAEVRPVDFETAAKRACQTKFKDANSIYPLVDESDLPYLCMDLVYQYTLLVVGFGFDAQQKITLVREIEYKNALVGATWPLGSAIEAISSL